VKILRAAFSAFDLVHVPREQNSRAYLLAKLASSGKGGRQRSVIQKTLKSPRTTAKGLSNVDHLEVLEISPKEGRQHQPMIQETLKVSRITIHELPEDEPFEVMQISTIDTWLTPYKQHLADGLLPSEPVEAKIVMRNACQYTLIGPISLRLYSPIPHLCKWRPMHPDNVRASRGHLWQPHWWTSSLIENHLSKVLLAGDEQKLR